MACTHAYVARYTSNLLPRTTLSVACSSVGTHSANLWRLPTCAPCWAKKGISSSAHSALKLSYGPCSAFGKRIRRSPSQSAIVCKAEGLSSNDEVFKSLDDLQECLESICPGFSRYAEGLWMEGLGVSRVAILADARGEDLIASGILPIHVGIIKEGASRKFKGMLWSLLIKSLRC
jgi:hypothetical protein